MSVHKKILAGILSAVILVGAARQPALAENLNQRNEKGFIYTGFRPYAAELMEEDKSNYKLTIENYNGSEKEAVVPAEIDGYQVAVLRSLSKAKKLQTLTIPNGITIERISDAPALKKIIVADDNPDYSVKNNYLLDKTGTILLSCPGGVRQVNNIPDSVTALEEGSFEGSQVKKITLNKNITNIGKFAFRNCKNLESITINGNVKIINRMTFQNCRKLKKVVLGKDVKLIAPTAFMNTGLKDLYLYNPKCTFCIKKTDITGRTVIHGKKGSTAEAFAKKNKLKFVKIR